MIYVSWVFIMLASYHLFAGKRSTTGLFIVLAAFFLLLDIAITVFQR